MFATAELSPSPRCGDSLRPPPDFGAELRQARRRRRPGDARLRRRRAGRRPRCSSNVPTGSVRRRFVPATIRLRRLAWCSVPGMERTRTPTCRPVGEGWPGNDDGLPLRAGVAAFVEHDRPDVLHLNDWRAVHARGARRPATVGALDPRPRLPGARRCVVARPDRTTGVPVPVVGRDEPAVGCGGARRPHRGRVAALRHRDRHARRWLRTRRGVRHRAERPDRHPQRDRHRRVRILPPIR